MAQAPTVIAQGATNMAQPSTQLITDTEMMAAQALDTGQAIAGGGAVSHTNLSMWDLFWGADFIIQLVMVGLIIASIWSWTIIIQKTIRLRRLNYLANRFEDAFWSGGSLDDLFNRIQNKITDPLAAIFCAAMREWRRNLSRGMSSSKEHGSVEQRVERVMHTTLNREVADLERHLGFLASLGTNAVIIGLFGTVLGIMNSFEAIAAMQNTNLAVVAPGIAEALFATAIGLVVAIPASIAYNKISSDLNRYEHRLEHFVSEFSAIISRQLEEHNAA